MKKYAVRTYRLNKSVTPTVILQTLEEIMQNRGVNYQNCLFKMVVPIIEFEHEGVFHSNREKNAISNICKKHPTFESLFKRKKVHTENGHMEETLYLNNYNDDYTVKRTIEYSILREVITKIPRPYAVNSLELVFDSIHFTKGKRGDSIKVSQNGSGCPTGDYILYERYVYGSEKHSYILFSAENEMDENMRKLFFEFAEKVPGKYEGTEIQF